MFHSHIMLFLIPWVSVWKVLELLSSLVALEDSKLQIKSDLIVGFTPGLAWNAVMNRLMWTAWHSSALYFHYFIFRSTCFYTAVGFAHSYIISLRWIIPALCSLFLRAARKSSEHYPVSKNRVWRTGRHSPGSQASVRRREAGTRETEAPEGENRWKEEDLTIT